MAETHISWVFFAGDHAYKLKKPVRTDVLDFTTLEARRLDCEREVDLNRRLAPDVYEGVATVTGSDGRVCDHLVVMRRLPAERRLSSQIVGPASDCERRRCLLAVARQLAAFHAGADRSPDIDRASTRSALAARWAADIAELRVLGRAILDATVIDEVARLAGQYLAGRQPLFEARVAAGRAVDGHGDLLADDIFCLDDGPRILDCLEFDAHLRWGDGLADAAFLAMDLERLGRPDLGSVLLSAYAGAAGDSWPASLADFYVAGRALVRSKVACLRAEQGVEAAAAAASGLLQMARDHLRGASVRLVLVGGLPGTGKSTLATGLGRRLGWSVLRSDVIRKSLPGPSGAGGGGYRRGRYDAASTARTYEALLSEAATRLGLGESVILDASWTSASLRAAARQVAASTAADLAELRCTAPVAVAASRITERRRAGRDASDATPEIARSMAGDADPWPGATVIDTTGSVDESLARAVGVVTG